LLWCGPAGSILFVAVFLVEGALRADYDPLRHPVSSLQLTERGWIQTASFVITGLLFLAFAVGVRRAAGGWALPLFLGCVAVGLIGAGAFRTYPIAGYPPGAAEGMDTLGLLHDVFSMGVFLGLPIACLIAAYRGLMRLVSIVTALAFLATFFAASAGFVENGPYGGLWQRVCLLIGWGWLSALALTLMSGLSRVPRA
jgi:hypothetical membrane protein